MQEAVGRTCQGVDGFTPCHLSGHFGLLLGAGLASWRTALGAGDLIQPGAGLANGRKVDRTASFVSCRLGRGTSIWKYGEFGAWRWTKFEAKFNINQKIRKMMGLRGCRLTDSGSFLLNTSLKLQAVETFAESFTDLRPFVCPTNG